MRLTKHHGLGNDFLVLLDADGSQPLRAPQVRALCDRHRGIGADGLIRAIPTAVSGGPGAHAGGDASGKADPAVAIMQLVNADGTPAEMSGNGIRCLAQALTLAGWVGPGGTAGPHIPIRTDAGLRTVTIHEQVDPATQVSSVDMGQVRIAGDAPEWSGGPLRRALLVDVGNPHLVLELAPGHQAAAERDTVDVRLVELGERVNAKLPDGANVHLLAAEPVGDRDRPGHDNTAAADASAGDEASTGRPAVAIRTYERGVGPTQACGTGACAAAAAARHWGLTGDHVVVHMAGGDAGVTLAGEEAELRGPATAIAAIEVPVPSEAAS